MPVATSTAYSNTRQITALVRALLNDAGTLSVAVGINTIARDGSNTVTVVTLTPHNLVPNDFVLVSGVTGGATGFNGTFQVLTVAGLQFTYMQVGGAESGSGGQVEGFGIGAVWPDSALIPLVNANYQMVQRELENISQGTFIADETLITVPAVGSVDPGVQVAINDATPPPNQLPIDLQWPLAVWERPSGSTDDFFPMVDLTAHGGLPSRPQGITLNVYEWRGDGLYFIGATQDVQIRLRYMKGLVDMVDGTSSLLLRNVREVVAYSTAIDAAGAKGAAQAGFWSEKAERAMEQVLNAAARNLQRANYRPKAYSRRRGYAPF